MRLLARIVSAIVLTALLLLSIVLGLYGANMLSQATQGVGVICLSVLVAVLARIAQASDHHAEIRRLLEDREPPK